MTTIRAWLDLLRIANLPTCLSNVLVGWVLAGGTLDEPRLGTLLIVLAVIALLYLGGMVLNDVFDATWDAQHRPDKPIARGHIRRSTAGVVGVIMLLGGLGLAVVPGPATLTATALLMALILIYDAGHRFGPLAILGMASCRVMVILVAAIAATEAPPAIPLLLAMAAVGVWTGGLTMLARREAIGAARRWPVVLLPIAVVLAACIMLVGYPTAWVLTVITASLLLLQLLWLGLRLTQPSGLIPAVLASIAGLSLLDALMLSLMGSPVGALIAVFCFGCVTLLHRSLSGT